MVARRAWLSCASSRQASSDARRAAVWLLPVLWILARGGILQFGECAEAVAGLSKSCTSHSHTCGCAARTPPVSNEMKTKSSDHRPSRKHAQTCRPAIPASSHNVTVTVCSRALSPATPSRSSVAALFGNGLFVLTFFCDQRRPDADSLADGACAAPKQLHDASAFVIKGIVAATAAAKSLSEINFVRLSLSAQCVTSVIDAPAHVRLCLKFHGGLAL